MKKILALAVIAVAASSAMAQDVSLTAGSYKGTNKIGVGLQTAPLYQNGGFSVTPSFELANLHRQGDDVVQFTATPQLRYDFGNSGFFVDGGVGAAALSSTQLGDKQYGTSLQLATNVGLGYRLTPYTSIAYRAQRFSNMGRGSSNDGQNMQSIVLTTKF